MERTGIGAPGFLHMRARQAGQREQGFTRSDGRGTHGFSRKSSFLKCISILRHVFQTIPALHAAFQPLPRCSSRQGRKDTATGSRTNSQQRRLAFPLALPQLTPDLPPRPKSPAGPRRGRGGGSGAPPAAPRALPAASPPPGPAALLKRHNAASPAALSDGEASPPEPGSGAGPLPPAAPRAPAQPGRNRQPRQAPPAAPRTGSGRQGRPSAAPTRLGGDAAPLTSLERGAATAAGGGKKRGDARAPKQQQRPPLPAPLGGAGPGRGRT